MRTGRGEDSKIATGNFEVYPRISPEVRGRGGDKIFEEKLHPSMDIWYSTIKIQKNILQHPQNFCQSQIFYFEITIFF